MSWKKQLKELCRRRRIDSNQPVDLIDNTPNIVIIGTQSNQSSVNVVAATLPQPLPLGETNPLLFLAEFEKCDDAKSDGEKTYKIRNFVDEEHKPEFSQLHFTDDWTTVKTTFIKKYSLRFIENKKREMKIDFNEELSLRSFVNRKLSSFAKYTTLPLINQMEIITNDLPKEISLLFMVHEKLDADKNDILDFCDSIQGVVEKHNVDQNIDEPSVNEPLNVMENFNYDPNDESDSTSEEELPESSRGGRGGRGARSGRGGRGGRGGGDGRGKGRGRTPSGKVQKRTSKKKLTSIPEDSELEFLDHMSNSSVASWSSRNSRSSRSSRN